MHIDQHSFIWAAGIENTFVPQARLGHRALDEYDLIGHYEHWRKDLTLAHDLGVEALRWGVPWYRVEPAPEQWDWRWTDQVIPYLVQELGITPIIDLMHYGCPLWMPEPFLDRDYPQLVARYAAAFAERYQDLIGCYTPLNEPYVNALMCGKRGLWPPYRRRDRGYVAIMLQLVRGIGATVQAIRSVDGQARMVHVEAAGISAAASAAEETHADEEQHRRYLSYDLLCGRVGPDHPLWAWLVTNGAAPEALAAIAAAPVAIDVMGLNFYPRWSTQQIERDRHGQLRYRLVDKDGRRFAALLQQYYERYQVPIMVTETSEFGPHARRARWLDASLAAIRSVRGSGVPVVGYTWFPLFTMIDWRYRFGSKPADQYRVELGLYTLGDDEQRWHATPLVDLFRHAIQNTDTVVGTLESVGALRTSTPV